MAGEELRTQLMDKKQQEIQVGKSCAFRSKTKETKYNFKDMYSPKRDSKTVDPLFVRESEVCNRTAD